MRCRIDKEFLRYAAAVLPWLARDPVTNNVAYTLIEQRLAGAVPIEPDALWLRVLDTDDALVGVALRTPWGLLLTPTPPAGLDALAELLVARGISVPAANGPSDAVAGFAAQYAALTGVRTTPGVASRLYRLDQVTPPDGVPGRLREATAVDRELLLTWARGFKAEGDRDSPHDAVRGVDSRLPRGGLLWIWEAHGKPVSMAWLNPPVAGTVRVSGVYTPPARRRQGYASAGVAAVSQVALDRGATACMLYTDLANPTSNSIYQKLGYYPVADSTECHFR